MGKYKGGFIVHPFETADSRYHASYGEHNNTVRSFKTLKRAKLYLKQKGISKAMYDSPTGTRTIKTRTNGKRTHRRTGGFGRGFGMNFRSPF